MKHKAKLLLLAVMCVLVLPLVLSTGNAWAVYLSDGARQNASGGWDLPRDGYCYANANLSALNCANSVLSTTDTKATCTASDSYTVSGTPVVPRNSVNEVGTWKAGCSIAPFTNNTQALCTAAGGSWFSDGATYSCNVSASTNTTQALCTAAGGTWGFFTAGTAGGTGVCTGKMVFSYTYQGNDQCLRCHNSNYMATHNLVADKSSYLKTGHKNMLRKVQPAGVADPADLASNNPDPRYTAGYPWAGPDSNGNLAVYSGDGTNTYNFANGSITLANGTVANLYWIYGDWIAALPTSFYGTDAYSQSRTTFGTNNNYTCANCHSTGFQDSTNVGIQNTGTYPTVSYTAAEPQASFPGLSAIASGSKFDLYGIQCSRCHYSTYPAITPNANAQAQFGPQVRATGKHNNNANSLTAGQDITEICFGCHQSTSGIGATATDPYYAAGQTQYDPTRIPVGVSHGASYGRDFNGHVLGNSFLNSPHAQFTGTFITNPLNEKDIYGNAKSQYASVFSGAACNPDADADCNWDSGAAENQGTCTTCHDVHQSLVIAGQASAPIRRECQDCHTNPGASDGSGQAPRIVTASIAHPTTSGTPFDNTKFDNACVVCHMAKQAEENGDQVSMPAHVWRINTSPTYNTFPSMAQFFGGSCSVHTGTTSTNDTQNSFVKVFDSDRTQALCTAAGGTWTATAESRLATEAPDGDYANAVWVDLDLACGQCHGGSGGAGATHNGAPYFDKNTLASYALGIHNNDPIAAVFSASYGNDNMTVAVNGSASYCAVGDGVCGALSYSWDFGDGSKATGATATHTYATGGEHVITLTVTSGADSGARSKVFNAVGTAMAPIANGTITANANTWSASILDSSTGGTNADGSTDAVKQVTVKWGDGTSNTQAQGSTFNHTYKNTGLYIITQQAVSVSGRLSNVKSYSTNVANYSLFTIDGTVTENDGVTAISFATVKVVKEGTAQIVTLYTAADGTFSLTNRTPGTYDIYVSKYGFSFSATPATVTVGPSADGVGQPAVSISAQ